jgi:purine-nucleoside phosphorylase
MAESFFTLAEIDRIAGYIRRVLEERGAKLVCPFTGVILGSGLHSLGDAVQIPVTLSYKDIPDWPVSTVVGHTGQLIAGELESRPVILMQGRVHYYEGYSMQQVTLPVRVLQILGMDTLIVTNAAGAVNPEFEPGDLMLITDHLNLIGMAGLSPLRGPNLDQLGPRFPDMSQAYDRQLGNMARQVAMATGVLLREGVYASLAGPSFETPADLRYLRSIGADAVGMSTVPEVTVARHGATRVLGISGISNKANLDGNTITTHEEVLQAGKILGPKLETILRGVMHRM